MHCIVLLIKVDHSTAGEKTTCFTDGQNAVLLRTSKKRARGVYLARANEEDVAGPHVIRARDATNGDPPGSSGFVSYRSFQYCGKFLVAEAADKDWGVS